MIIFLINIIIIIILIFSAIFILFLFNLILIKIERKIVSQLKYKCLVQIILKKKDYYLYLMREINILFFKLLNYNFMSS